MKYVNLSRKVDALSQRREYHFLSPQVNADPSCQLYILVFENLPNCVTLVPSHVLLIMINNRAHQGGDVISLINDLPPNLQPFVIRYKKLFSAIIRLLNTTKFEKKYINSTNDARFLKYKLIFIYASSFTSQNEMIDFFVKILEYF